MYKETIITEKARAFALVKSGQNFLFYRDKSGAPVHAEIEDLQTHWEALEFFTCSYPIPRTIPPLTVKILVGANAYACIDEGTRKTDILLSPGRSAPASLREYAEEQRERAAKLLALADLAERAATELAKP